MKILILSNYYPEHAGGIEFVALNLVGRLRRDQHVRWIACDVRDRPHASAVDDLPLPALNFTEEIFGFPYPLPIGASVFKIFRQVKWCDLVHIHDSLYFANILAFLASRWYRKPLLVTQHVALVPYAEVYKNILQQLAYSTIGKLILENAEKVVFISPRVKQWFETHMRLRGHNPLIPNGVDDGLFYPQVPGERELFRSQLAPLMDGILLLFVGRFTEKKGIHLVREFARARPHIFWLMVGSGEIDPREWNLPNVRVIPSQPQSELRRYYIAADSLVLPSVGEGFPLVIQEAMACGVPVIVSQEIADFLPDAPLLTLDLSSAPAAMLQALEQQLAGQERLLALGRAAADYARRWNWENVSEIYKALYLELTSSHKERDLHAPVP